MADHLQHELKREFQIERMILFSDAIFAIAITILVLELKVPAINRHIATDALLLRSLDEMVPRFIGFLFSFFIIGRYWITHHSMFGYVVNYNSKTLWLNLLFLLGVVLMPFSTSFFSEYVLRLLNTPLIVYVSNVVFLGVMNFFLWKHLSNPVNQLTEGLGKQESIYHSLWALLVPCILILMAILYLTISPRVAIYVLFLVPFLRRVIRKKFLPKSEKTAA